MKETKSKEIAGNKQSNTISTLFQMKTNKNNGFKGWTSDDDEKKNVEWQTTISSNTYVCTPEEASRKKVSEGKEGKKAMKFHS